MFQICFCGEESMYVMLLGDIMRRGGMGNKDGTVQCYIKTVSCEKLQKMADVQFHHSIKGSIKNKKSGLLNSFKCCATGSNKSQMIATTFGSSLTCF